MNGMSNADTASVKRARNAMVSALLCADKGVMHAQKTVVIFAQNAGTHTEVGVRVVSEPH